MTRIYPEQLSSQLQDALRGELLAVGQRASAVTGMPR